MRNKKLGIAATLFLLVLVLDQLFKIWVKTHFYYGEDYEITSWFHLKFIENNGMAFGLELWNKLVLTFGRIAAVGLFIWFIFKVSKVKSIRTGFLISIALIAAGAAGNIIDCVFYGQLFNNPLPPEVASFMPEGGGYAGWFEGRVVDMLYFPLFSFNIGGTEYEFFQYIFNLADSAICVGVFLLILFYSRDFSIAWKSLRSKSESEKSLKDDTSDK